ncbi:MAG: hypothetical protein NTX05_00910 [Fusobacteria bacterium]|nr:hypothetical protein [Fusobacteriota bacterium]
MKKIIITTVVIVIIIGLFGCMKSANTQQSIKYWTVGSGGDFATLQEALASSQVVSGSNILVYNGTYTVNSTIVVSKPVNIVGETQNGVIFETAGTASDPIQIFNIIMSNVQLSKLTILNRKSTNTSVESAIVVSNPNNSGDLLTNININNCTIGIVEFGIVMRAGSWNISKNTFEYTSTLSNQKFYPMGIYAVSGNCNISGNSLINSSINGIHPRFIYLTSTNSGYNTTEKYTGTLTITGNSVITGPYFQFYNQDNWSGATGQFNLIFENNTVMGPSVPLSNNFIIFYAGASNFADILGTVTLKGNSLGNKTPDDTGGKGIIGIDGGNSSAVAFRSTSLTVYVSQNNVVNTSAFLIGFEQAEGSENATVGYNTSQIILPIINQVTR